MLNVFAEGEGVVHASDGARIFFRTAGEGELTALFLHGWAGTGSGSFWDAILRGLGDANLRSVILDLRGHGRSDHTRDGFTTERFARDVFDVADHLGAHEFIVVAYSMSGRWAQWMSCTTPERVLGQVLIAPVSASPMPLTEATVDDWLQRVGTRDGYHTFESSFTKERLAEDTLDDCFSAVESSPEFSLRETLRMCAHRAAGLCVSHPISISWGHRLLHYRLSGKEVTPPLASMRESLPRAPLLPGRKQRYMLLPR